MALINCPFCGEKVSDRAETCVHCGKSLKIKRCPECGAILSDGVKFCKSCGCPVETTQDHAEVPPAVANDAAPITKESPAATADEQPAITDPASTADEQPAQPTTAEPAATTDDQPAQPADNTYNPGTPKPAPANGLNPKIIAGIIAAVVVIACIAVFATKKSSPADKKDQAVSVTEEVAAEEEVKEEAASKETVANEEPADSFIEKSENEFCDNWKFYLVIYVDDEGEVTDLYEDDFRSENYDPPTFNAYKDHTFHLTTGTNSPIDGTWKAYDESICDQLDSITYSYSMESDNSGDMSLNAFVQTDYVDASGNAEQLAVGLSSTGESQFIFVFTK